MPIVNAGFEDISGQAPFNEFTFGAPNGWTLHDPNGVANAGAGPSFYIGTLTPWVLDPENDPNTFVFFPAGAAAGTRVGIAFNSFGSGDLGEYGIIQTLEDSLEANTAYSLQVEIGNITSGNAISGQFFNLLGFPGYRVDLLAGGVVIAQDNNTLGGVIGEGQWETSTVEIAIAADHPQLGQPLAIRLVNLNVTDATHPEADLEVDFDDVRLTATPTATCEADIVPDGVVGLQDLLLVISCWGAPASGECAAADIDDDGSTGLDDLLAVIAGWGECSSARSANRTQPGSRRTHR